MQSVWKPAEWLHFYADSMPVLPYFRLCIGSLSLFVMSLTAPRPNPKCYDRGQAGLNAADMRLNILQSFLFFFTVLNRNNSIWWRICSTKQKQHLYFDQGANTAAGFTEPLHFHYGTPLTHFSSCLGCLHEVYEVNYLGHPGDRKDQCRIALVAPVPIGSLMFRRLRFDLR